MPWIPKKGALRKLREERGYSIYDLAARAGISERQIRNIESDAPPAIFFNKTISVLATALAGSKEDLAMWVERRPNAGLRQEIPTEPRTLEQLAERERQERLTGQPMLLQVETRQGTFELLGAERAFEIHTKYAAFEGERFIVMGSMTRERPLSEASANMLGIGGGVGAQFEISRPIFDHGTLAITVATTTPDLTRLFLEARREVGYASLLAELIVVRPDGQWRGFETLSADAEPVPYAFIVEDMVIPEFLER